MQMMFKAWCVCGISNSILIIRIWVRERENYSFAHFMKTKKKSSIWFQWSQALASWSKYWFTIEFYVFGIKNRLKNTWTEWCTNIISNYNYSSALLCALFYRCRCCCSFSLNLSLSPSLSTYFNKSSELFLFVLSFLYLLYVIKFLIRILIKSHIR